MLEQLKNAAEHIFQMASKTSEEAKRVKQSNILIQDALEKNTINEVKKMEINGKICAIDGGLLAQEMHGVDLIISRGACACFEYEKNKLKNAEYFPNAFPSPEYIVKVGLDEHEINAFRSLFRLETELNTAINAIEKLNAKTIMLDGSLIPLSSDRPQEGSEIFADYCRVIEKYKKLYSICEEKKIQLLGVIKDSRGRRFMDSVKAITKINSSDTVFLNHLLEEKQRTFALRICTDVKKHPVMKDLKEYSEKLNLFYLKSVKNDMPMRVEYLSGVKSIDEIASEVYSLSCINESYAYPAVLIEADLRAMLDPKEMERMQKTLQILSNKDLVPLKRNSRPFR